MLVLPLKVGDEMYAVGIDKIKEVIPVVEIRPLPESPDYMKGLINYRGTISPVIDLCMLIKGYESKYFLSTRIVMIEFEGEFCSFGLIAEQVTETINIDTDEIHSIAKGLSNAGYIQNTIIKDGKIIQLLNPKKIFSEKITIFQGDNTI